MAQLVTEDELATLSNSMQRSGSKIGLSTGVFDVLSPGIIEHLMEARKHVDVLIVGVISDNYVDRLAVSHDQLERLALISAISYVDYVFLFNSDNSLNAITSLKPNFFIRGTVPTGSREREVHLKEQREVEKYGGRLIMSSSQSKPDTDFILFSKELKTYLRTIKTNQLAGELNSCFEKLSRLRVLVIGETIIDQYTMVNPLGKSSKDPLLAFEIKNSSILPGGILSIAEICSRWVKEVSVISYVKTIDDLSKFTDIFGQNINFRLCEIHNRPTILKHRFVDSASDKKVFEYYNFSDQDLTLAESGLVMDKGQDINEFDVVLVADYGHGLFTPMLREWLSKKAKFLVINTQANAGNRGYNTISKYERCDFFSLNSSELQLELRNRNLDYVLVVPEVMEKLKAQGCVLTLGGSGVMVFDNFGFTHAPALARLIVDKVGAGDALFSISSLLATVGASKELIALLGNIVAAFEVSQLGHNSSLSLLDLRECALSILNPDASN